MSPTNDFEKDFIDNPCFKCGSPPGVLCQHDEEFNGALTVIEAGKRERSSLASRRRAIVMLEKLVDRYRHTMPSLSGDIADVICILEGP